MTIMTLRKIYITMMFGAVAFVVSAGPSILDIKHSITDDNVIPPESFETKTRELEENFYLKKYTAHPVEQGQVKMGNPEEYEQLLSRLPTEIEMPYNPVVGRLIEMYLGKRRGLVADMLALHNYYGKIFIEELIKEKVPLELQYLPVIESAINPNAVSRMGSRRSMAVYAGYCHRTWHGGELVGGSASRPEGLIALCRKISEAVV